MRKDIKRIYSGTAIVFSGKIINSVARYGLFLIIGRYLGPEQLGLYFLGFAIMRFSCIGAMLGFQESLQKFIPEYKAQKKEENILRIISLSFHVATILSVLIAVLLYFSSEIISVQLFHNINLIMPIQLFAICLPFFTVLNIQLSVIRSFKDMLQLSFVESIVLPAGIIAFIPLFFNYLVSIESVILAQLCAIIMASIITYKFLKKKLVRIKSERSHSISLKKTFSYTIPMMGSGIMAFFLLWMDTLMIGILLETNDVGIYSVAARTALFSNILLKSVNSIFAPTISKLYAINDLQTIEQTYKTTAQWLIHLAAPVYLCIFIFSETIMGLFGSNFVVGASALIILSLGQLINISMGSSGCLLTMTGNSKTEFYNRFIALSCNFFLNLYLIPILGINGAAVGTATSLAIVNILRLLENYKNLRIHPFSLKIIWPFVGKIINEKSKK